MAINTISDITTRKNRHKIIKDVTNSYSWINMTGSYKINVYNLWASFSGGTNIDISEWVYLYWKYLLQYVSNYDGNATRTSIVVNMVPNDNTALWYYSDLSFWATTKITSAYVENDTLYLNYQEWAWVNKQRVFDLVNRTWTTWTWAHSTWDLIDNNQKTFLWYYVISNQATFGSSWIWYSIVPYIKFVKS